MSSEAQAIEREARSGQMLRWPNLFIAGAARCGSTALHSYLAQHPDVFMSKLKEINYFGEDLVYSDYSVNEQGYLDHFAGWQGERYAGESSVWYLVSKSAAAEIKERSPDAKIIILLRNPVDMLYSHHHKLLFNGNQDIASFAEAIEAGEARKQGRQLPEKYFLLQTLFYRDVVRFAEQVERFIKVFGRERIHIQLYDDFAEDAAGNYRKVLSFLELDQSYLPDFQVVNANQARRSQSMKQFFDRPPDWAKKIVDAVLPQGALRRKLKANTTATVDKLNTASGKRPTMDPALRQRLTEEFRPEVERLATLIDRDLSRWHAA